MERAGEYSPTAGLCISVGLLVGLRIQVGLLAVLCGYVGPLAGLCNHLFWVRVQAVFPGKGVPLDGFSDWAELEAMLNNCSHLGKPQAVLPDEMVLLAGLCVEVWP